MQIPSIGRTVIFRSRNPEHMGGGAEKVPAIITRVWSATCVNLQIMRDADAPLALTSVLHSDDLDGSGMDCCWSWPERV